MSKANDDPSTLLAPTEMPHTLLPSDAAQSTAPIVSTGEQGLPIGDTSYAARYANATALAEGGMGAIETCLDRVIGRVVAMKKIRAEVSTSSSVRTRFVREARVQGQLEHPAIVPVYDLGRAPDGAAYFTMKRVRGVTLAEVVDRIAAGDSEADRKYSRRKLLSAMASVCLAIDFAHSRGVVHRDLKPSNIMLGDFGEVYVLDWGIARVEAETDASSRPSMVDDPRSSADGHTAMGALLGTPGYMSPEQCRGLSTRIGPPSDVYSLGAILFEILTLQPLHPGASVGERIATTITGADARATERVPDGDIPPELEEICVRATRLEPEDRFPSARALHDAIDGYLEGERNLDLRRDMARQHVRTATAVVGSDLSALAPESRAEALREAGRALALDPGNLEALRIIYRLISEPPRAVPAEVRKAMADGEEHKVRITGRIASAGYASLILYLPMLLWLGIRSTAATLAFYALAAVAVLTTARAALAKKPGIANVYAALVASNLAFAATGTIFGPLLVTPMLVAVNTAAFALHLDTVKRMLAIAVGSLAIIGPIVLQMLGYLPKSYRFEHGELIVLPGMVQFPEVPTLLFLLVTSVAGVLTGSVLMGRLRDAVVDAELQLQLQQWQLRHLVP